MDVDPRVLDARQRQALIDLADSAARSLDARRTESEVPNPADRDATRDTVRSVTDQAVRFAASDAPRIESIRGIIITVTVAGGP